MTNRSIRLAGLVAAAVGAASAHAQLRICTWNVTNFTTDTSRNSAFQTAFYGVVPTGLALAGKSMSPDVIIGQEFINQAAVNNFLAMLNTAPGSPGDWAAGAFNDGADTDNAFFYRTSKVQYLAMTITAIGSSSTTNQPRNTNRYDFRPLGYSAPSATIGLYSAHFKAQGGTNDAGRRLIEAERLRDNAEGLDTSFVGSGLPAGYLAIFGGDTNITTSSAAEYVEMVGVQAVNTGRFFDPIATPGNWNNNAAFDIVHTQDPVGQMDDRHDQMLITAGLFDGAGIEYIGNPAIPYSTTTWNDPNHSYRSWGNDGTAYNLPLRTTGNTMVGAAIAQALINTAGAGGHLPIIADFKVPAKVDSPTVINFGQVPVGGLASQSITISNAGNTALWTTAGISNLTYTLSASSGFGAPGASFSDAPGGGTNSHNISMFTATPGIKTGTLTITSSDPDQPTRLVTLMGEVVAGNQDPIADAGPDFAVTDTDNSGFETVLLDASASFDTDGTIVEYTFTEGETLLATGTNPTASVSLSVGVHTIFLSVIDDDLGIGTDELVVTVNPAPNAPPTANAGPDITVTDIDNSGSESVTLDASASSDTDGTIVQYTFAEGPTILAQGPSATANVSLPVGVHTITLTVTDDDTAIDTDTLTVTVNPAPACVADVDDGTGTGTPDGGVTVDDLLYYLTIYGQGALAADVDDGSATGTPDGGVTVDDLLYFLTRFNAGC
ncbi:MAG: GC-type dockerin domain-anchored protein [Phycisphaerales bacterium]